MGTDTHAATLGGCFPHLAASRRPTDRFDGGWDCAVVVLDGELVARLPRRSEVQGPLRTEARFLELLGRVTEVPAPRPLQTCEVHGSMVYRLLPGAPLREHVLDRVGEHVVASQLAEMLRGLWGVSVATAIALGVPHRDLGPTLQEFRRRVLPLVDDPRAARLLDEAGTALQPDTLAVIHADVGPAHLLCDDGGLAGVIDWSDVCIGDPATDLAWLLNGCGGRLREPLIDRLGLDAATVARADLLHRLGPWWEVVHGLDQHQPQLVDSGLDGIRSRLFA